jgi:hypothetical protein
MAHVSITIKRRNFVGNLEMARQMAIAEIEEFCEVDLTQFCDDCLDDLVYITINATRDDSTAMDVEIFVSFNTEKYLELLGDDDSDEDDDEDSPEPSTPDNSPVTEPVTA